MKKRFYLGLLGGALLVGCGDDAGSGGAGGGSGGSGGQAASFTEAEVLEAYQSFETSGFTRVTKDAATSQHGASERVIVWVNDAALEQYLAIDPEDPEGTSEAFPVGTILIKQGATEAGEPDGAATVMAKFESGFNSEAGDWWWGRFTTAGELADSGVVGFCISCHEGNGLERTDYLAGTPTANRL